MMNKAPHKYTLLSLLENSATAYADRPALSFPDEAPITYNELYASVHTLAERLTEKGISFGDRVVILSENCPQWGIAYFAITSIGAVAVPILTEFHPDGIAHIVRHSEAKSIFVSEKMYPKLSEAVFESKPLLINLDTLTAINQGISKRTLQDMKAAGLREFRKWMEKAGHSFSRQEPEENDLAAIIYTSGTTGHSKGVMLSHKNIVFDAYIVKSAFQLRETDCMLSILPLAHTFECTLGLVLPMMWGAHVVYLDKVPTARILLPILAQVRPTVMISVPLIMEKIYKTTILPKLMGTPCSRFLYGKPIFRKFMNWLAGKKLLKTFGGRLRIMAIGGAPIATDAEAFLREAKFPYAIGYGLTETAPLLTGAPPEATRAGSAGKAIEGVELRLININPQSGEGEIQARGANVMQGYYKLPEVTAEVLNEDGWFSTGDLGAMDSDGYVYIKGRSKNMILGPSGENIYPEELESIFFTSTYVQEVLVYESDSRPAAKIFLDAAMIDEYLAADPARSIEALLEEIRQNVNSKVPAFARIYKIHQQTEPFEKTPTQKIKRYLYVDM